MPRRASGEIPESVGFIGAHLRGAHDMAPCVDRTHDEDRAIGGLRDVLRRPREIGIVERVPQTAGEHVTERVRRGDRVRLPEPPVEQQCAPPYEAIALDVALAAVEHAEVDPQPPDRARERIAPERLDTPLTPGSRQLSRGEDRLVTDR